MSKHAGTRRLIMLALSEGPYTARELVARTGKSDCAVRCSITETRRLGLIRRDAKTNRWVLCGKIPPEPRTQPREWSNTRSGADLFHDELRFADDARAQFAFEYFERAAPITTVEEVMEMFAHDPPSEAEARGLLRYLAHEIRLTRQGYMATLEEIGDLLGTVRERARQVQNAAIAGVRRAARKMGIEEELRSIMLEGLRRQTTAERMELMAFAEGDLGSAAFRTVRPGKLAERSGQTLDQRRAKKFTRTAARARSAIRHFEAAE